MSTADRITILIGAGAIAFALYQNSGHFDTMNKRIDDLRVDMNRQFDQVADIDGLPALIQNSQASPQNPGDATN